MLEVIEVEWQEKRRNSCKTDQQEMEAGNMKKVVTA